MKTTSMLDIYNALTRMKKTLEGLLEGADPTPEDMDTVEEVHSLAKHIGWVLNNKEF